MNLELLPREKLETIKKYLDAQKILTSRESFIYFVTQVWPDFVYRKGATKKKWGHHQLVADKFNRIANGTLKRLIVNMPPRHTKSEFASYLLPAWIIGRNPKAKIMQVSHNAELSQRFGRKVRNLVDSEEYKKFSRTSRSPPIRKQRDVGKLTKEVSTMQRVWGDQSQVVEQMS